MKTKEYTLKLTESCKRQDYIKRRTFNGFLNDISVFYYVLKEDMSKQMNHPPRNRLVRSHHNSSYSIV